MVFVNTEGTTYEDLTATFSWDTYQQACDWDGTDALNMGHESVDRHQGKESLALIWRGADGAEQRFSFDDLAQLSNQVANALEAVGIERGDRVFTYLPRIPEHYAVILGTLKTGAVFGAINERYGPDGIAHRLDDSRAAVVVTTAANADIVRTAIADADTEPAQIVVEDKHTDVSTTARDFETLIDNASTEYDTTQTAPDDPALLYYTSGTTGPAKGVLHGHRFTIGNAAFVDLPAGLGDDDLYWCTADPGWLTGLNPLGAWFHELPILVYEGEFDPTAWAMILDEYPVNVLYSVPTAYRMFREHESVLDGADLSSVRTLLSVGEPLNPGVIQWARETFGAPVLDTYGTSESYGTVVANYPLADWKIKPGSMGKPYPGIDIRLVEPGTLEDVATGETGEIAVRTDFPSCFLKYWERPNKTAEAIQDGWLLTDDLAMRDEDGYLHFEGRADDVILSAGYRIGPFDVESTLVEHDAVAEAAVVPSPDEQRGNVVKAFVVPASGTEPTAETAESIQMAVRERLAAHEYPRELEFVEELPKTVTGKIRRTELRDREQDQ